VSLGTGNSPRAFRAPRRTCRCQRAQASRRRGGSDRRGPLGGVEPPAGVTGYLDRDDVLTAGAAAVGHALTVGDYGLLDAAVARAQATAFGVDAYPDDFAKAAALLQSLARNHAFVDGNMRTAWAAA
jgi:Fic/DOC family